MSSLFICTSGAQWGRWLASLLLCWLALTAPAVWAAKVETLMMPGKVISGHAKNESDCNSCHSRFDQGTQNTLCLDCHKPVAADLRDHLGFHGRDGAIANAACSSCHTDHKGRDANIVPLNQALFDHRNTDFELLGRHKTLDCDSCHKPDPASATPQRIVWREAPSACLDCHRDDDVHQGRLGKQCNDCHDASRWQATRFDHDKTDFVLRGAHADTSCAACHPARVYKDTPKSCASCHAGNDVHGGGYGDNCKQCHNTSQWREARFDHFRTDFHLVGAHQRASCSSCHQPGQAADAAPQACVECHRSSDIHKGRNGDQCQNCHTSVRWSNSRFDHDRDTRFSLIGGHKQASCNDCHTGGIKKDAEVRSCFACHQNDDVHQGELGKACDSCHRPQGWRQQLSFDHDLTAMPLYGMHALASCESCHSDGRYASTPHQCSDCHQNDDSHKGALGNTCQSCHNPNSWKIWQFDHNKTDFALQGRHDGLACNACHQQPPADQTPSACVACHRDDDIHQGNFGPRCEQCHNPESFTDIRISPLRPAQETSR